MQADTCPEDSPLDRYKHQYRPRSTGMLSSSTSHVQSLDPCRSNPRSLGYVTSSPPPRRAPPERSHIFHGSTGIQKGSSNESKPCASAGSWVDTDPAGGLQAV